MNSILHRLNQTEISSCLFFNRINHSKVISQFFSIISRLGNGIFWYVLMLSLPIIYGASALKVVAHMLAVAIVALVIYKRLKTGTQRVRPFHYNDKILQNVPALDQFSFPSGHTMHAVSFTTVLLHYYPEWMLLLIPFTILIGLSRLILGLHYPSDVIMGVIIGYGLAISSFIFL